MLADHDIVGNLDQVVDLVPSPNPSAAEARSIDRGVCADLTSSVDLDDADLRHFDMPASGKLKAESIAAKHDTAVEDDAISQPRNALQPRLAGCSKHLSPRLAA
jgi:hypothetical protein